MRPSYCYLAAALTLAGCAADGDIEPDDYVDDGSDAFTSDEAVLVDFGFDGELTAPSAASARSKIKSQLMYTVGQLNGEPGVSRLDKLALSNIRSTYLGGGLYRIRYHAELPVAWGRKADVPAEYELILPRRADSTGQNTFTTRYGQVCNDGDDHSVTLSNYWYHYRPLAADCALADADVTRTVAQVTVSTANTTGKYPEYHRVWEDGALSVVAVFGKYEDYATSDWDAGIQAYNRFVAAVRAEFPDAVTSPALIPAEPGVGTPDVTFHVSQADGTTITIVALLIDGVRTAGAGFDARYAELTPGADVILYNGHAGLGANVRALSHKGRWFPGKYLLFFMNGCDTFAYLDGTLAQTRAALNPDDPTGTRHMEIISNAMPAYFHALPSASMALIRALRDWTVAPQTYEKIFRQIDRVQVVVVDGEADNEYTPELDEGPRWNGFYADGAVGYRESVAFTTEVLEPGRYVFAMIPDPAAPGGDADLRVRVGAAPTSTATYRCRSYLYNSNERCVVDVTTPAAVFMTSTGDRNVTSRFRVYGWQQ